MPATHEETLDQLKRDYEAQNIRWGCAMRTLASMGSGPLTLPREFLEQLDALAMTFPTAQKGLRA